MRRFVAICGVAALTLSASPDAGVHAQNGGWGDVKGVITWGGDKVPERQPLDLKVNPDKKFCEMKGPILEETWIVNPKNKGLRCAFVWLAPKDKEAKLPIHPSLREIKQKKIIMDQPICMFIPHALALREGQSLVAKNSAGVSHNFKWSGHPDVNPGNNVLLPPNTEKEIDDLKADRLPVSIECNIHPWMRGWVRVFNHPYYAVTDANGAFELKNAPAGEWQLFVWHGSGGWLGGAKGRNGQTIEIKAGGATDLKALPYPPPPP
ncbi:MAG: hypothetical protein L0Y71_16055 [Gemmataceae bacterium]|nr:hypothetical protein [Gemmataceae bacterium]